jgi:hypothetical protein
MKKNNNNITKEKATKKETNLINKYTIQSTRSLYTFSYNHRVLNISSIK